MSEPTQSPACPPTGAPCPALEHHFKAFNQMKDDVAVIKIALLGRSDVHVVGALQKIDQHEAQITSLNNMKLKVVAFASGAYIVLAAVWEFIKAFFPHKT